MVRFPDSVHNLLLPLNCFVAAIQSTTIEAGVLSGRLIPRAPVADELLVRLNVLPPIILFTDSAGDADAAERGHHHPQLQILFNRFGWIRRSSCDAYLFCPGSAMWQSRSS